MRDPLNLIHGNIFCDTGHFNTVVKLFVLLTVLRQQINMESYLMSKVYLIDSLPLPSFCG